MNGPFRGGGGGGGDLECPPLPLREEDQVGIPSRGEDFVATLMPGPADGPLLHAGSYVVGPVAGTTCQMHDEVVREPAYLTCGLRAIVILVYPSPPPSPPRSPSPLPSGGAVGWGRERETNIIIVVCRLDRKTDNRGCALAWKCKLFKGASWGAAAPRPPALSWGLPPPDPPLGG